MDSDYAREDEGCVDDGVMILRLGRKEIENYLIEPTIWQKIFTMKGKQIDLCDIKNALNIIMDKYKNIVGNQLKWKHRDELSKTLDPATKEQETDEWFERKWADEEWRLSHCPGKMVLSELKKTLQNTHKVAISNKELMLAMKELPEDLSVIMGKVNQLFYST